MTVSELLSVIRADASRYGEALVPLLLVERVFRHMVGLRVNAFLCTRPGALARVLRVPALLYWYRARTLGFDVSPRADIGPGLYVAPHPGGVVVHPDARIGANCNLHHGVTIGRKHRGPHTGVPRIGDNVWIGPGAKLVGAITVGSDAVIGPNCVVSDDVASAAVLAVARPQTLSRAGSNGYVERARHG
jgi:serine O-acetyltransferase